MLGHVAQPVAKHLWEGLFCRHRRFLQPHGRVKLAGPVVGNRVHLSEFVALAFLGHHMQKLWAGPREHQLLDVIKRRNQGLQVMAINRADIIKAKRLK